MKFNDLEEIIDELIVETFSNKFELVRSKFKERNEEYCSSWFVLIKEKDDPEYQIIIEIPKFLHAVELYIVKDLKKFNKEFWFTDNETEYLIMNNEDVILSKRRLNPYQAYRFISVMKKHEVRLPEYEIQH